MKRVLIFVVCYLAFLSSTFAATEGDKATELFSFTFIAPFIDNIFGKSTIDVFVKSALGIAGNLNGLAMKLAGAFALIAALWAVMMAILNKQSVLVAVVEPLIFATLTVLLLNNYGMIVNDVVALGNETIAAAGSTIGKALTSFIDVFLKGFIDLFIKVLKQKEISWKLLEVILETFIAIVFLAVAAVLLLIAVKDLLAVLLLGPISLGVGVALGPLFVATLPWEATRKWLGSWLNYLINAAMITAVAVIVLVLFRESIVVVVKAIVDGENGSLGKVIAIAMIASTLSKVFSAIPDMTSALFPGRAVSSSMLSQNPGNAMTAMSTKALAAVAAMAGGGGALAAGAAAGAGAGVRGAAKMANAGMANASSSGGNGARSAISIASSMSSGATGNHPGGGGGGGSGGGGSGGGGSGGGGSGGGMSEGAAGNTPDGNGGGGGGMNDGAAGNTPDGLGGGSGGDEGIASAAKASQTTPANTQSPSGQSAARAVGNQEFNKSQIQGSGGGASSGGGRSEGGTNWVGQKNNSSPSSPTSSSRRGSHGSKNGSSVIKAPEVKNSGGSQARKTGRNESGKT